MKFTSISFSIVLVLGLALISAGCMQSEPGMTMSTPGSNDTVQQTQYTSNETLVAFVESAVAYVKENGKENALAEFNNPNGSFVRGELYIYAYDFNGTTLAHPVNPEKVGVNRLNETEADVGIFLAEMNDAVRDGDGFHRIVYINPAHNGTLESKLAYGVQVDEGWWLGSGVYTGPADLRLPAAPADYPEMIGIWRADGGLVYFLNDTVEKTPTGENTWVVNSQDGRVISGSKMFSLPDGTVKNQTFVGIFVPDGETIMFVDQQGEWGMGSLVEPDSLFIAWTNPGDSTATVAGTLTLNRDNAA